MTKQRRSDRIVGTVIGCILTALVLRYLNYPALILAILVLSTVAMPTFAYLRYRYAAIAVSMMILLEMHLLTPGGGNVVMERLIDTLIGAAVATAFSFVLPNWEFQSLPNLIREVLGVNLAYMEAAFELLQNKRADDFAYRIERKRRWTAWPRSAPRWCACSTSRPASSARWRTSTCSSCRTTCWWRTWRRCAPFCGATRTSCRPAPSTRCWRAATRRSIARWRRRWRSMARRSARPRSRSCRRKRRRRCRRPRWRGAAGRWCSGASGCCTRTPTRSSSTPRRSRATWSRCRPARFRRKVSSLLLLAA